MRTPGLSALLGCALACSGPPSAREPEPEPTQRVVDPAKVVPSPAPEPATAGDQAVDPLLALARGQIRGGRAPAELRRELLESGDPDHRHAGRLLQAIADEKPEPVLTRARGLAQVELAEPIEPGEPIERPATVEPPIEPTPASPPAREPTAVAEPPSPAPSEITAAPGPDDESWDPPPKLSSLPADGPVRAWFDAGVTELEPEPAAVIGEPELSQARLFGPELLLLRERPPVVAAPMTDADEGPRLVILTSMAIRVDPSGDAITLELSGAGPAALAFTPCSSTHVRVRILNAGAVPGFLAARPTRPELEVVEVARRDTIIEVEIEFARGWTLIGAARLANGASVRFERER
ncbi:hypothetical protein [Enhygromyxa salina]|uniref:Uncharacterized protein n=1 Tax=Enhygromyxa salina TaxID=215803 RepID=A0A2S9YQ62_9BACT|nr:hypothetical protein [Enhygromyxa salina]PRQ07220.1 hypothetical protein ENSA7_29270 [Enhygromyxa salina]